MTATQTETIDEELTDDAGAALIEEFDLPELADTMQEATARAAATRYLFALRNVGRELCANDAEHKTLIEDYGTRHTERQATLDKKTDYLRGVLEGLFGFMEVTGKKKSLNLLGGRLGMRSQTDELVVDDDAAVIEWSQKQGFPSLIKTKATVDRKALRAYAAAPSTISGSPPGVTLNERPDVFFATPAD